jgi:DNA repair exonuclease SbcCD ATPase subunit
MPAKKPSLKIEKLVLVGRRKNYSIPFQSGLNIVYGDSATGKSSILECINYLLGSSKFVYDREIESAILYLMMQVTLNGSIYTIKRDLFDAGADVEVFPTSLDAIEEIFPQKYSPSFEKEGRDGYYSDFLLSALNMPNLKMRQAPTKDESPLVRLSFRDIFQFCYLKQDDVGAKSLLGDGGYRAVKNRETFKYLFNLLDTTIADLQSEISAASANQNRLHSTYKAVSDFLRTVELKTEFDLDEAIREVDERRKIASGELQRINTSLIANNESYRTLKELSTKISARLVENEADQVEADHAIERFVRLKNDYKADIAKLKSIRVSQELLGSPQLMFSCPLCESAVKLDELQHDHQVVSVDKMTQEINALTRRTKELDALIERERSRRSVLLGECRALISDRDDARRMLDEEMGQAVTPYLAERDSWSYELAKLAEEQKNIERNIKIRNQQKQIFKDLGDAIEKINSLNEKLAEARNKAPSADEVLTDLSDALFKFLTDVQISDLRDVRVDSKTLLPVLRDRDYRDTTSGGLRTILSIGHFLTIAHIATLRRTNFPGLLMIDTVGKYLGKTSEKYSDTDIREDSKESVADPKKYLNIFRAMLSLGESKLEPGIQIIAIDNDIPPGFAALHPTTIAAHFDSEGADGAQRGLIDDAYLH